jgi:hypothetical protein
MKMLLKGGRPSTAVAEARDREDSWILHASAEFSKSHVNTSPEEVAEILIEHFVGLLNLEYEMDVLDSHAYLWDEGLFSDFGPYVSDELREARSSEANFMKAFENGGWGRAGIDGALFDPARGIGIAGDWLVEGSVEGAFLSGQALASRVVDAHASYVPSDFTLAPTKYANKGADIDHSDRWGYGDWPDLDVESMEGRYRWNGRPVTKHAARSVVAAPILYGDRVGRPLTHGVGQEDPAASFANWVNAIGLDPASRPGSTHRSNNREGYRIIKSDDKVDFLALPSRPTTQHDTAPVASPTQFGAPAPPRSRPGTRGLLKVVFSSVSHQPKKLPSAGNEIAVFGVCMV